MLKLKCVEIDTFGENVAFLNRRCIAYRPEDFQALNKIEIIADGHRLLATLNIADDPEIVAPDEIGLSIAGFKRFGMPCGAAVSIIQAKPPASLDAVRQKINGEVLSADALYAIIDDIAAHRYSKMEIAAFLVACAGFMTTDEVLGLTRAMASVGGRIDWGVEQVVDKHCIGGIPGNRTSMIVVPIVAAHGLPIPKTSSRAITSPAGTADTMEVLANVDVAVDDMRRIVRETNGCLVWGGHVNLSPADDILISVERPLGIDTREQLVASILSKKVAAGSTDLLLDIPIGPTAKVRSRADANRLRKLFEHIAQEIGIRVDVVVTDGAEPIGRGIGPVLEARDVMAVLRNEPEAPTDLKERAILLAGRVLEFDPKLTGGEGENKAREILTSGAALAAMERIIAAQGRQTKTFPLGPLTHEVTSSADGVIGAIDCYRIARIARIAGAPIDKGAGIDLLKKVGDPVQAGEPIYRIHAHIKADFLFARDMANENNGYAVVTTDGFRTPHG